MLTGGNGSVALAVYGGTRGPIFWVTSNGQNSAIGHTTNTILLEVSNQFALVETGPDGSSVSSSNGFYNLKIYHQSNSVLESSSLGVFKNIRAVDSQRYKSTDSSPRSRFFSVDPTSRVLSCYVVDRRGIGVNTEAPSLNIVSSSGERLSVSANSIGASEISLQISTNLSIWSDLITITQPKPTESLIIPIGGRTNLFLKVTAN